MTDPKPEQRGKGAGFYVAIVFGALVLYVLSSGPVNSLAIISYNRHVIQFSDAVYAPLRWFVKETGTERWYFKWFSWWVDPFYPDM